MKTFFRNPFLMALCLALLAGACKNSSPADAPPGDLWQLCDVPAVNGPITKFVTGRNGILFALVMPLDGRSTVLKSIDSAKSWSIAYTYSSLLYDITSDKRGNLFVVGTSKVWRSTDDGNSWTLVSSAYISLEHLTPIANDWLLGSSYDMAACYLSKDMGQTWVQASGLAGYGEDIIYAQKTNTVYLKTYYHGANVNEWSSTDNGSTWSLVRNFPYLASNLTPNFCLAVDSTGRVWALDQDGNIFLNSSLVGHSSFGFPYVNGLDYGLRAFVLQVDFSGMLLLGGNKFHYSSDSGVSWVTNTTGMTYDVVTAIGSQPGGVVLAGTGSGQIYRSTRPITK
jgi:hypothetical protein